MPPRKKSTKKLLTKLLPVDSSDTDESVSLLTQADVPTVPTVPTVPVSTVSNLLESPARGKVTKAPTGPLESPARGKVAKAPKAPKDPKDMKQRGRRPKFSKAAQSQSQSQSQSQVSSDVVDEAVVDEVVEEADEARDEEDNLRGPDRGADRITAYHEDLLVEWFEAFPIFYDQSRRDFKDRGKRDKLLHDKGIELALSGNLIWQWFKNMRTVFGKLKKKKSGQAATTLTARQVWTITSFKFLEKHLVIRSDSRKLGQVPDLPQPPTYEDLEDDEDDEEDSVNTSSVPDLAQVVVEREVAHPPAPNQPKKRRLARKMDDAIFAMVDRLAARPPPTQTMEAAIKGTQNDRHVYCQYLGTEAQSFTNEKWTIFQQETLALMIRLRQQEPPQQHLQQGPQLPTPQLPQQQFQPIHLPSQMHIPQVRAASAPLTPLTFNMPPPPPTQQQQPWQQFSPQDPQASFNVSGLSTWINTSQQQPAAQSSQLNTPELQRQQTDARPGSSATQDAPTTSYNPEYQNL